MDIVYSNGIIIIFHIFFTLLKPLTAQNDCVSNPCLKGTCSNLVPSGYNCTCIFGYTGTNCDTHDSVCVVGSKVQCTNTPGDQTKCENLGCCYDSGSSPTCYHSNAPAFGLDGYCTVAFGDRQECGYNAIERDECVNTRRCCWYTQDNTYYCFKPDRCSASPCQNGGTCVNQESNYTCTCGNQYAGNDCQTDLQATTGGFETSTAVSTDPTTTLPISTDTTTTLTSSTSGTDTTTSTSTSGTPTTSSSGTLASSSSSTSDTSTTSSSGTLTTSASSTSETTTTPSSSTSGTSTTSASSTSTTETTNPTVLENTLLEELGFGVVLGITLAGLVGLLSCGFFIGNKLLERQREETTKLNAVQPLTQSNSEISRTSQRTGSMIHKITDTKEPKVVEW